VTQSEREDSSDISTSTHDQAQSEIPIVGVSDTGEGPENSVSDEDSYASPDVNGKPSSGKIYALVTADMPEVPSDGPFMETLGIKEPRPGRSGDGAQSGDAQEIPTEGSTKNEAGSDINEPSPRFLVYFEYPGSEYHVLPWETARHWQVCLHICAIFPVQSADTPRRCDRRSEISSKVAPMIFERLTKEDSNFRRRVAKRYSLSSMT
jgi:hypothetical protein